MQRRLGVMHVAVVQQFYGEADPQCSLVLGSASAPIAGHRTTAGTAAEAEAEEYSARASCFVVIDHTDFIRPSSSLPVDRPLLLRFARAASSLVCSPLGGSVGNPTESR